MADGRKASTSGNRYFTRKRSKKSPDIVELSDSSSESNDGTSFKWNYFNFIKNKLLIFARWVLEQLVYLGQFNNDYFSEN